MNTRTKIIVGFIFALTLIVIGVAAYLFLGTPTVPTPGDTVLPTASSTEPTGEEAEPSQVTPAGAGAVKNTLPPEIPFVLPEGATAIDDNAFILDDQVYFRSLTGAAPLAIPNSDADSFKRLTEIMTYPGLAIISQCGATGSYTFYGDDKQVYFYQFWRSPKFRASTIEVIKNVDVENFKLRDPLHVTNGTTELTLKYGVATSTCSYALSPL